VKLRGAIWLRKTHETTPTLAALRFRRAL
jgi:hypothetical protein